jgi:hypothetical protein
MHVCSPHATIPHLPRLDHKRLGYLHKGRLEWIDRKEGQVSRQDAS